MAMTLRPRFLVVSLSMAFVISPGVVRQAAAADNPRVFGRTAAGETVHEYTLTNSGGMIVRLITLGAAVRELHAPDRRGELADVVLGFDDVKGYQSDANQYFGCIVGRVANRIANGRFTLKGKDYQLAKNNGPNHLHGGAKRSLDKVVWRAAWSGGTGRGVRFRYASPDGEEGYPGKLDVSVTYALSDKNELQIELSATTDKATPVNLAHHGYFNLAGAGAETVLDHELAVEAGRYTPTDDTLIPTGKIETVKDAPLDFTRPRKLNERIAQLVDTAAKGYDHNYVLRSGGGKLALAAQVRHGRSGRVMKVYTTQPGLQLYSGNFLFGQKGKGGRVYRQRSALCLETQHFPDAVNKKNFPSIVLQPGETYKHTCVYAFSVQGR